MRSGFTLLEAIIAMSIASLLVILVSQVFLSQNEFYAKAVGRNFADDAVRTTAEFLGAELRGSVAGGVVVATQRQAVLRSAIGVGGICDVSGSDVRLYMPGISDADTTEAKGYATRDSVGDWVFTATAWGTLLSGIGASPADDCEDEGVDTTGARNDFVEFQISSMSLGDLVMLYRETNYEIKASALDESFLALYRGENGGTGVELATGLMAPSQFEYLVGSTWYTAPGSSRLDSISEIRVTVEATGDGDSTATDGYSASVTFRVPLQGGGV
jgi:prepilin-type N-terminal cleavage/methylation domain-containing protein